MQWGVITSVATGTSSGELAGIRKKFAEKLIQWLRWFSWELPYIITYSGLRKTIILVKSYKSFYQRLKKGNKNCLFHLIHSIWFIQYLRIVLIEKLGNKRIKSKVENTKHFSGHSPPSTDGGINCESQLLCAYIPKHLALLALPFNIIRRRSFKPWSLCLDFREPVFITSLESSVWANPSWKYQNRDIIHDSIKLFLYLCNLTQSPSCSGALSLSGC